jgi:hypothetical protein
MSKYITVTLDDGSTVVCAIVERSCNYDPNACVAWCSHNGREFVAVRIGRVWRERTRSGSVVPPRGVLRGVTAG